jgi:hypothetical protein
MPGLVRPSYPGLMSGHLSDIDALFELPPEEFTAARDRLAKDLADRGDKEAAREVKSLRRPTAGAWAVNQVVRRHPQRVERLIEVGEEIRTAQRRAASGLSAEGFARGVAERRAIVSELAQAAAEVLRQAGRTATQSHLDAAGSTFEAAASDPRSAHSVRSGRLSKEVVPPSGFEVLDGLSLVPGGGEEATTAAPARPSPTDRKAAQAQRDLRAAERDVERWTRRAATAREESRSLEREAREAEKEAQRLERDLDRSRKRAEDLGGRSRAAARKAEQAERSLDDAESRAQELREKLRDAR